MAQKALFNFTKRSDKRKDAEILDSRGKRVTISNTDNISGNAFINAVTRAKSMSERILGDVLGELQLVTSQDELDDWADLADENGIMALDTETTGLHAYFDQLAGICLYTPGSKGIYVPVGHISNLTKMPIKENVDKDFIVEMFEWLIEGDIKIVYHNAKFELNFFYWNLGIDLGEPYWDTFIGGFMLNENESHNLKQWHQKYCTDKPEDAETAKFNQLFKGIKFNLVPPEVGYMYAGYDGIMTYEAYEVQKQYLDPKSEECKKRGLENVAWVFHNIEMPLIYVLFKMEIRGVSLNQKRLDSIRTRYEKDLAEVEEELYDILNSYEDAIDNYMVKYPADYNKLTKDRDGYLTPNLASSVQMASILYDLLGLENNDKNKPRGTGDDIIGQLNHPFANGLQKHRKLNKILTTYTTYDRWLAPATNRIHTNYKQNGAKTGRMSSEDPSIMNIPAHGDGKIMRTVFEARKGFKLVGSDYSQQEPRLLAFLSQDMAMIKAYREGKDLYAFLGAAVFKVDYEECLEFYPDGTTNKEGKHRRNSMKSILLGIMYGRQEKSIAEQIGVSAKEARKVMNKFFSTFPRIAETIAEVQGMAREKGYVETLLGRKRRLPDMQLDPIEITPTGEGKAAGVELLDFDSDDDGEEYVPEDVWNYYASEFQRAWGFKQKNELRQQAREEGYEIKDNGGFIAEAERQCLNSVIQGSAADLTKLAMIKISKDPVMAELDFHLLIPVHDELIGEAPEENAEAAGERLSFLMKEASDELMAQARPENETLPMKCDVEITDYWYQGDFENLAS